ncbi:hypothetical protein SBRCBS47491_007500 [Sporothrix bragantina]|uniref:Uncharacterized protein n=1 Tax=Sporothrix bragantina TaxID=671064 RepID=A0ABP0CDP6_9PEZI
MGLQQLNGFATIESILEECLVKYKGLELDETWQHIAYEYDKYYNQMAYVLLWQGRDVRATEFAAHAGSGVQLEGRRLLQELVIESEEAFGPSSFQTLELRVSLRVMHYLMGELEQANSWPKENTVRAKYYLSQVLKQKPGTAAATLGEAINMRSTS